MSTENHDEAPCITTSTAAIKHSLPPPEDRISCCHSCTTPIWSGSHDKGASLEQDCQWQSRSPSPASFTGLSNAAVMAEKARVPSQPPTPSMHDQGDQAMKKSKVSDHIVGASSPEELALDHNSQLPLVTILAFIALCLSIFFEALNTVIIPTALPTISHSFDISDSLFVWVGSSYLLANAASVPFWGKLSDIFGTRPMILTAHLVFLLGSIINAVSVSVSMLLTGRAVQGFGGGGIVALAQICVTKLFPIRDRSFYLGIIGAVWAVAYALGPVVGGALTQMLTWRWCFYINLPFVCCSIVILYFTLHLHNPQTPFWIGLASMDWLGTLTICTAALLLLVGLQLGSVHSYATPSVVAMIVLGSLAYFVFPLTQWWVEKRGGGPIMPLRIFKDISNTSTLSVVACDALVFSAIAYFLPFYFQVVLGKSPATAGVYMLAIAIPLAAVSFASGHVIERTGRFLEVLQAGLFCMTLGIGLLILFSPTSSLWMVIGFPIIIGIGFGPNFGAPLIALQSRIREEDVATGVSTFGFVRMVFGAVGVVASQVVFQLLMAPQRDRFLDNGISSSLAHDLASGKVASQYTIVSELPDEQRDLVRGAFAKSLRGTWIFLTVLSALGLIFSIGIKRTVLKRL